jgi:hypothetical protein
MYIPESTRKVTLPLCTLYDPTTGHLETASGTDRAAHYLRERSARHRLGIEADCSVLLAVSRWPIAETENFLQRVS